MVKKHKTSRVKKSGGGSKKPKAILWNRLGARKTRSLLYAIAKWRILERDANKQVNSFETIASKIEDWLNKNAPEAYNPKGKVSGTSVGRYMANIIKHGYIKLGSYVEEDIVRDIRSYLTAPYPHIVVAPDENELLRYVWEDLDELLMEAVDGCSEQVVLGVSGGQTMLALARAVSELRDLRWWRVSPEKQKKVVICSLTSGGVRRDIATLSDTVAGTISTSLGVNARGLLGPAWFPSKKALKAFCKQPDVAEHEKLVTRADFIVTSVGYLDDTNALMSHLLRNQDQDNFLQQQPNLADILYHCYDGITGEKIDLPPAVANGLLSFINIARLKEMVKNRKPCLVVARGRQKGRQTLRGILIGQMANYVYMDYECAEGLIEAFEKHGRVARVANARKGEL